MFPLEFSAKFPGEPGASRVVRRTVALKKVRIVREGVRVGQTGRRPESGADWEEARE